MVRPDEAVLWELAGMGGDTGMVGSALPVGSWRVPELVELGDDGRIYWHGWRADRVESKPGMLDEFLRLDGRPDASIVSFAGKWGLIYDSMQVRGSESIGDWRNKVRDFRSLLTLAARAHLHERPTDDEWLAITQQSAIEVADLGDQMRVFNYVPGVPTHRTVEKEAGQVVAAVITEWLAWARTGVVLDWPVGGEPSVQLSPNRSLIGALIVQVAFASARSDGLAICSACSRPYLPRRRPSAGRRNYCADCGVRAARRDAQREYRNRQKGS